MTTAKVRAGLIGTILQGLLGLAVLVFAASVLGMFVVRMEDGIRVCGITACAALIVSVGMLQLVRWDRIGLALTAGTSAVWAACLFFIYPEWLADICGETPVYIPFAVSGGMTALICVVLFVPFGGKNQWRQMSGGLDVRHFRHIYQLSLVLLVGVGTATLLRKGVERPDAPVSVDEPVAAIPTREISYALLDSSDVRFDEVVAVEAMLDTADVAMQVRYRNRVYALKHILLSGIMPDDHDPRGLLDICKVHGGEFSEPQQRIVDWFVGLPKESQAVWKYCPPATDLSDFKIKLENKINSSNK